MTKKYTSLGLMSGTSGDGVDASIIISDGINSYEVIEDKYFEYDKEIYKNIHNLKERINNKNNLNDFSDELNLLEKKSLFSMLKLFKNYLVVKLLISLDFMDRLCITIQMKKFQNSWVMASYCHN